MKAILNKNDPILRQIADPIQLDEIKAIWLDDLVNVMFDIMKQKGALGIAAPQIGINTCGFSSRRFSCFLNCAYNSFDSFFHSLNARG